MLIRVDLMSTDTESIIFQEEPKIINDTNRYDLSALVTSLSEERTVHSDIILNSLKVYAEDNEESVFLSDESKNMIPIIEGEVNFTEKISHYNIDSIISSLSQKDDTQIALNAFRSYAQNNQDVIEEEEEEQIGNQSTMSL